MAKTKDLKVKVGVETDELIGKLEIIKELLDEISEKGIKIDINFER